MTQFVFFTGPPPDVTWLPGVRVEPWFPTSWAGAYGLIPERLRDQTWHLAKANEEPGEVLCTEARTAMHMDGAAFDSTRLGRLLREYLPVAERITLFDAGYPETATVSTFYDATEFLDHVAHEVRESADGSVFARYDAVQPGDAADAASRRG